MSDKKLDNVNKTISAVTSLVKEVPIYQDALQPFAKETGKALQTAGKAINLALKPIEGLVWGFEKISIFIEKKLEKKLEKIPIENITPPLLSIAGPVFESLRYLNNEEILREMYINLLANSIDTNTSDSTHPSFVEIIKQLSSGEAKLLLFLSSQENYPDVCSHYDSSTSGIFGSLTVSNEVNIIFFNLCSKFEDTCNISSALDNYKRLKILDVETETNQKICSSEFFYSDNFIGSYEDIAKHMELEVGYNEKLFFTSFGKNFIESCVIDK